MKKRLFKAVKFAAVFGLLLSTYNCSNDDNPVESTEEPTTESRWVTIAGSSKVQHQAMEMAECLFILLV